MVEPARKWLNLLRNGCSVHNYQVPTY